MNKILLFLNHPFVKLIFNKLKEVFGSKEFKELTVVESTVEPVTEEVTIPKSTPVIKETVTTKSVAKKPVVKNTGNKTTNKK
jgi:hypothetical protein